LPSRCPWRAGILGYPGQRAPGAGVDAIDFELLYGLSGKVTYPFLHQVEIGARLGRYAGQQPPKLPWRHAPAQDRQYQTFRELWKRLTACIYSAPTIDQQIAT
jgi:hypothetical protein